MERVLRSVIPRRYKHLIVYLMHEYFQLSYISKTRRGRKKHDPITLDVFDEADCWERFRCRKEDIPRLQRAFKLDSHVVFVTDNGMKFNGLEVILIGLHRYSCVGSFSHSMRKVFNLDFSTLSRVFKVFNNHMIENFEGLLNDNLKYWEPWFEVFAEKIRAKLRRYYFIATLLRNAHTCLYGGITSTYFNCQPPTLEDYFE